MSNVIRLRPVDEQIEESVLVWQCGACDEQEFYYRVNDDGQTYLQCCNCDTLHQPWIYD